MSPTLDLGDLFPSPRLESLPAERAVLGALMRGTLRPRDVAYLDVDAYWYALHGEIHDALLVVAAHRELWPPRARSVSGLPLAACRVVCELRGLLASGYLHELAAAAPVRREALEAVGEVYRLWCDRSDAERLRGRMLDDFRWWAREAAGALKSCYRDRGLLELAPRTREAVSA